MKIDTESEFDPLQKTAAHFSGEQPTADFPAWEEIETGRFMPRRVRGSCQGRALG